MLNVPVACSPSVGTRPERAAGEIGRPDSLSGMTKWEYVTVPLLVHATKQILDNWGSDGWELVQVVPGLNPENLVAYLKRPVTETGAGA
jgi:hypothetical protein